MISQKHAYIDWLVQQQRCIYCGDAAGECGCDRKEPGERMKMASSDMYEALKYAMRIIEVEHIVVPFKCQQAIAKAEGREEYDFVYSSCGAIAKAEGKKRKYSKIRRKKQTEQSMEKIPDDDQGIP